MLGCFIKSFYPVQKLFICICAALAQCTDEHQKTITCYINKLYCLWGKIHLIITRWDAKVQYRKCNHEEYVCVWFVRAAGTVILRILENPENCTKDFLQQVGIWKQFPRSFSSLWIFINSEISHVVIRESSLRL